MLIDLSYFTKGTRHLLNAYSEGDGPEGYGTQAVRERVEGYISTLQLRFLFEAVGYGLAKDLDGYLTGLDEAAGGDDAGGDGEGPDPYFESILAPLREPFADYVAYRLLRDAGQDATITGLVDLDSDNGYVDVSGRMASLWNDMVWRMKAFASVPREGVVTDANLLTTINTLNI